MTGRVSLPKLLSDWKKGDWQANISLKKNQHQVKKKKERTTFIGHQTFINNQVFDPNNIRPQKLYSIRVCCFYNQ